MGIFSPSVMARIMFFSAETAYVLWKLKVLRSLVLVLLLSPCVRAPKLSNLLATMLANLFSPCSAEMTKTYLGAVAWLERCVRPNCWMAESADQGSSMVMWTLLLWLATLLSACREMPVLAASEMIATFLIPDMNCFFSNM